MLMKYQCYILLLFLLLLLLLLLLYYNRKSWKFWKKDSEKEDGYKAKPVPVYKLVSQF